MNKPFAPLTIALLLILGTGCAGRYDVVMRNNVRSISKGKPRLIREVTIHNETTGKSEKLKVAPYYQFTDIGGQERRIPQTTVLRIHPTSDRDKESVYYVPTDYQKPDYWNQKQPWQKKPWYKRL